MYYTGHFWEQGRRQNNQDSLALWHMTKGGNSRLFGIICDGIGGLEEGEKASGYVVHQVSSWFVSEGYRLKGRRRLQTGLHQLLFQLHEDLVEYGRSKEMRMGTTMTLFLADESHFFWCHCGDSRLYLCRRKKLRLLTGDHIRENGALNQAIGVGEWKILSSGWKRFLRGDSLLLCTDGFYRKFTAGDFLFCMGREMESDKQIERILRQMGQRKLSMGEKDNISALLCVKAKGRGR